MYTDKRIHFLWENWLRRTGLVLAPTDYPGFFYGNPGSASAVRCTRVFSDILSFSLKNLNFKDLHLTHDREIFHPLWAVHYIIRSSM